METPSQTERVTESEKPRLSRAGQDVAGGGGNQHGQAHRQTGDQHAERKTCGETVQDA